MHGNCFSEASGLYFPCPWLNNNLNWSCHIFEILRYCTGIAEALFQFHSSLYSVCCLYIYKLNWGGLGPLYDVYSLAVIFSFSMGYIIGLTNQHSFSILSSSGVQLLTWHISLSWLKKLISFGTLNCFMPMSIVTYLISPADTLFYNLTPLPIHSSFCSRNRSFVHPPVTCCITYKAMWSLVQFSPIKDERGLWVE